MSDIIVETKNLSKKFGDFKAVDNINLQVKKGRIYGFLGPNGAGKSTTIRILLGLMKPTKGKVKIFNKDLKENRMDILKRTGSMVESPSYYGNLTAYENLEVIAKLLDADMKCIDEALDIVRLSQWRNKQVKKFSLGMKQRLGIAGALLGKPELLILDEPTNGLDPSGIHEIRELIKNLPKLYDMTVIISSHILNEIDLMADDIGIINNGELLFQGTLDELHKKSAGEICIGSREIAETVKNLRGLGYVPDIKDKEIFVKIGDKRSEELLKDLIMKGDKIFKFIEKQKTLEEIFLDITKEGVSL